MKIAVFPGTFAPFHDGHFDVVKQLENMRIFDKIIVAHGLNATKNVEEDFGLLEASDLYYNSETIEIAFFEGLLVDYLKKVDATVVVRGLRNISDFEYEKSNQYWNEDLGIHVPTMYVISDRKLTHLSSSAIRMIDAIRKKT